MSVCLSVCSSLKTGPEKEIFKKSQTDRGDNGKDVNRIAAKKFLEFCYGSLRGREWGKGLGGGGWDLPSQSTCVCETFLVRFF